MLQNIEEAKRALTEKPLLATSIERFLILNELKSSYKELPQPLRFSKILSQLLSRVSVPLEKYDFIAGRCVDRELSEEEEALFQEYLVHPDYPSHQLFWSSGHCTYSWELLVKEGLVGLREKAAEQLIQTTYPSKQVFLSAMIECYDAILAFVLRYAKAAEENGIDLYIPDPILCTDNGAMIGAAAYYKYRASGPDDLTLDAYADLEM